MRFRCPYARPIDAFDAPMRFLEPYALPLLQDHAPANVPPAAIWRAW